MSIFSSVSGALSVIGTVGGIVSGIKSAGAAQDAADAQSQAVALQRQQQQVVAARQRREVIRERRIAAAQNQARASAQGMTGSSSISGIQGALNTNLASNLNFLDVNNALTTQRGSFLDEAAASQAESNIFAAGSRLGFTVGGQAFNAYSRTPEYLKLVGSIK